MDENVVDDEFGAGIPFLDKIQLVAEWYPFIAKVQAIGVAETAEDRALAIVKALQWAAGKSANSTDDEALFHLEALLKSPEGKAFFDWCVKKVTRKA